MKLATVLAVCVLPVLTSLAPAQTTTVGTTTQPAKVSGRVKVKVFEEVVKLLPRPADAPAVLAIKPDDKFIIIGDSITAGGGYLGYIDLAITQNDPAFKDFRTINAGKSGHKAEDLIARYQKDVLDKKPTVVAISIGINDVWHRLGKPHDDAILAKYKENVSSMVDQAQKAGARVILLAPTVIKEDPDLEGNKRLPLYVNAMKEIAADKKCQMVDLHDMFIESIKHKPADMKGNWLTSDGVHMQSRGNAVMALGVLRALGVPDDKIAQTTDSVPFGPAKPPATKPATKPAR